MTVRRSSATPIRIAALLLLAAVLAGAAHATRVKDLCQIQGARGNMLIGTGLVVGLAGTGDKTAAAVVAQQRVLERLDILVDSLSELKSDNCAVVMVTAVIPAFAKEGTRIDVVVSSMYDCESLEGGTLLETHLTGPGGDDTVYVVAQGPLSVGGFNAAGGGGVASVRRNHVTTGRIPMGGYVENEAPSRITDGERVVLLLKRPDFTTADNIQAAINAVLSADSATALGAGAVHVVIPQEDRAELVAFLAQLLEIDVQADMPSRVIINERTGTIVIGGAVMIKPCQVAHGNLTIKVARTPLVSQPAPFGAGQTVETEVVQMEVEEVDAHFMPVEGTSAGAIAEALNKLKVTPRDVISIFQALREAGALEADLEIM